MHAAVTFPGSTALLRSAPLRSGPVQSGLTYRSSHWTDAVKHAASSSNEAFGLEPPVNCVTVTSPVSSVVKSLAYKHALYIFKIKATKSTW